MKQDALLCKVVCLLTEIKFILHFKYWFIYCKDITITFAKFSAYIDYYVYYIRITIDNLFLIYMSF